MNDLNVKLIIENPDTGKVYAPLVEEGIKWTTDREGTAGLLHQKIGMTSCIVNHAGVGFTNHMGQGLPKNKNALDRCQGREPSLRGTTLLHPCLTAGALGSAGSGIRYSCAVSRPQGFPRRPRSSETMFGGTFGARFQLPGLSVTYLSAYSSLHCLW